MRTASTLVLGACLWLASVGAGMAQGVDSGTEVRVNPVAGGGGVLLYPGGQYSRYVPTLLYPGQKYGPIHLHMPSKHRAVVAAPRKPKPVVAKAAPAPAPTPAPSVSPPVSENPGAISLFGGPPAPPPPQPKPQPAPKPQAAPKPAPKSAAEPATPGMTKRSVILFAPGAPDPAEGAMGAIKFLAGDLSAAMTRPSSRIEIQAFGGAKGDKGSDARRLSLKRALSIRQVLIDDGVAAERIDVRAMGGIDDTGPADRVDVYVKA
jgi:outer membrane protein OmpA-like peptidoglycan-associated protein